MDDEISTGAKLRAVQGLLDRANKLLLAEIGKEEIETPVDIEPPVEVEAKEEIEEEDTSKDMPMSAMVAHLKPKPKSSKAESE